MGEAPILSGRLALLWQKQKTGELEKEAIANFYNPKPSEQTDQSAEEIIISNPKRRKPAVQKIFDQEDWSPLQAALGTIRSKKQDKDFDFVDFIHKLKNLDELSESSSIFQNLAFQMQKGVKDLLNVKKLTFSGIRQIVVENVPPQFFLKYVWENSAKKWFCTKKTRNLCLWERYLCVCFPHEKDFLRVVGESTKLYKDTDNCCTTGSISLFSQMAVIFATETSEFERLDFLPSPKYAANNGPFITYNVDSQTLTLVAKVRELNPNGEAIPR